MDGRDVALPTRDALGLPWLASSCQLWSRYFEDEWPNPRDFVRVFTISAATVLQLAYVDPELSGNVSAI